MESVGLSETDLQLIHALQIHPRAPWSLVGEVLGVTAATVARRWTRLSDGGLAWVTGYRTYGPRSVADPAGALVNLRCRPSGLRRLARQLASHHECFGVEIVSGDSDLALVVLAQDHDAVGDYLLGPLAALDGVESWRVRWITRVFTEPSRWRLDSLTRDQARALARAAGPRTAPAAASSGRGDAASERLADLLAEDGRMSFALLGERAGVSEATARRKVAALLESGRLALRCDLADKAAGSPTFWIVNGRVAAEQLETVARGLAQLPQARLVVSCAGDADVSAAFWLPVVPDVHRMERSLTRMFPDLQIVDRLVGVQSVKRVGRLLTTHGRLMPAADRR